MKVSRLPKDPGPAAWNAILPSEPVRPSLEQNTTADWLVVGAGFAGLSAARRLAELNPADRIVVLEACAIADGPAGRNSGFMIDVPHDLTSDDYGGGTAQDQRDIRLNRAGIAYALDAKQQYVMSDEAINTSGKINGAVTPRGVAHNDAYAKHLEKLAEPYQRLSADDMQRITGTSAYIDGLYSPGTVMIQPAQYIRLLAKGIESNRVQLYEHSPVTEWQSVSGVWQATTAKGRVSAAKVILAVNGHLQSFGYFERRLVHVFTYASMTNRLTPGQVENLGGEPNWALTPADPLGTTVRRISGSGGDRIVIRNRATFDPKLEVTDKRIAQVSHTHDQSFRDRFPMLGEAQMEYRWGGRLCLSLNNVPAFGAIDRNLYAACCQNGLGTAKGTISGKLAAELASGHSSPVLEDQLTADPPTKLPPAPIVRIGATARLRWGEFRAGKEL